MKYPTIPELFLKTIEKFGEKRPAIRYKQNGEYKSYSRGDLRNAVECFALALSRFGIGKGDRVGIVSENRLEWVIADLAIVSLGAVDAPVFPILTSKQERYIFNDCSIKALIVSNNYQLGKIAEVREEIPSLETIIVMNEKFDDRGLGAKSFWDLLNETEKLESAKKRRKLFLESAKSVKSDDLLTLIYTSGTTGDPKGVMLTHANVSSNALASIERCEIFEKDVVLSYLPLCHSYERTTGYYAGMFSGAEIAFAESADSVAANMLEIRPTFVTTVPRLLEVVRKRVYANIERSSAMKKKLFAWAIDVGKRRLKRKLNGKTAPALEAQYAVADRLVFAKIRQKTGGRIRVFVSGGAALAPEVCEFFNAIGLTVIEGYGLTEAAPVVAANSYKNMEIGTVGEKLDNVEVKIAPDGELLVRGPNVMKGYWNNEDATRESIDDEGWLYTGDIAEITPKNNIKITDRKKHIFVSVGGKNIAPQPIENLLAQSKYVEQCFLVGDAREFNTALIAPNFEELKKLADELEISYKYDSDLVSDRTVLKRIQKDFDDLQKDLAKYERVRRFSLLTKSFSVEEGELSPKMSVRRHVVEKKYSDLIESMYGRK